MNSRDFWKMCGSRAKLTDGGLPCSRVRRRVRDRHGQRLMSFEFRVRSFGFEFGVRLVKLNDLGLPTRTRNPKLRTRNDLRSFHSKTPATLTALLFNLKR